MNVPAVVNLKLKVPPTSTFPLSNVEPLSLVTVWGADDAFFQVTVVPALIVSIVGLKPKLPLLPSVIITVCWEPGVGVGRTVGVGVGCTAVGSGVGLLAAVVGVEAALVGVGCTAVGSGVGLLAAAVGVEATLAGAADVVPPQAVSSMVPITTSNKQSHIGALRCRVYVYFDI